MSIDNHSVWSTMIYDTMSGGVDLEIRGSRVKELSNYSITIDPIQPFMQFYGRTVNLDYIKRELRWYIGADRFDTSIAKYAKIWADTVNDDGSLNSNYGQYWFGDQAGLLNVVQWLRADKHTRRASIPMLRAEHVGMHVKDSVCTESMTFQIRNDCLNLIVHMRSSDQIYGLGNDIPTFAFLQRLALALLLETYPNLCLGMLTVTAASSHIYQRHFELARTILSDPRNTCNVPSLMHMPTPTAAEAMYIATARTKQLMKLGPMTDWLMEVAYD